MSNGLRKDSQTSNMCSTLSKGRQQNRGSPVQIFVQSLEDKSSKCLCCIVLVLPFREVEKIPLFLLHQTDGLQYLLNEWGAGVPIS